MLRHSVCGIRPTVTSIESSGTCNVFNSSNKLVELCKWSGKERAIGCKTWSMNLAEGDRMKLQCETISRTGGFRNFLKTRR